MCRFPWWTQLYGHSPVARNPTGPPQKCTYVFFKLVVSHLLLPPTSHTCFFHQRSHLIVNLMIPALRVETWPSCHSSPQTCSQLAHCPLLHLCIMLFLPLLPLSLMPPLSSIKSVFSAFSVHSIQTCFRVSHLRKKILRFPTPHPSPRIPWFLSSKTSFWDKLF